MVQHNNQRSATARSSDRSGGVILAVGEVLFDVFVDERRIGGAPFNFAFQLHKLGFPVCFVSAVGADADGDEILQFMSDNGMRTDGVQTDAALATGKVLVRVDDAGKPEYEILEDRAYDRIKLTPELEALARQNTALVCFGTLAQRAPVTRETMRRLLDQWDTVKVCDLNLRQQFHTPLLIDECLRRSDIVKINDDELRVIMEQRRSSSDERECCARLVGEYDLRCLCVTRGGSGSELYLSGGARVVQGPVPPGRPGESAAMKDTVGAGDAYTAMLCAGFLLDRPWEAVISAAARFAAALCTVRGALPGDDGFYAPFREELESSRS